MNDISFMSFEIGIFWIAAPILLAGTVVAVIVLRSIMNKSRKQGIQTTPDFLPTMIVIFNLLVILALYYFLEIQAGVTDINI